MAYRQAVRVIVVALLVIGLCGMFRASWAGDSDKPWVSRIVSVQGRVLVKRLGEADWRPARLDDTLSAGDQVRVEVNSRAGVVLSNDAVIRLDQNTTLVFTEVEQPTSFVLKLLKGAAQFFSRQPRHLEVVTPFVNGVVEGTEFFVQVDEQQSRIDLFEGRVRAFNQWGELQLTKGQSATATTQQAPRSEILARPRDSVQWALYYPPVLAAGTSKGQAQLEGTMALSERGQTLEALSVMDGIPESRRDSHYYAFRAGLLLNVGRVAKAREDIRQALSLDGTNSDAMALSAVIAVVQNQKQEALAAAQEAARLDPESATALIALSYAYQAVFDLPQALKVAQEAVTQDPENAIAWARLAELRLSTGELDQGVRDARRSTELNPDLAHAHTILGFAYLTQIKTPKAQDAFKKAIALDSSAPLPRLGLGLARIRDGHLEEGRAQIEIAAGLDPDNALIRSYLGKAYFDEKREPLDERQFETAKALDPNDPTPWFYDAIRKQTLNRPVEALQDLQESIKLNDNRAVYRSRLMLDEDLASRSASLGRIYNELGFRQLGLVEGWHSVNTDPSNYSAHRFLSDSYSALPRHEVARVSELLQSQLLQPINLTPVQPQLSESDLFVLEGSGPAEPSLNEFNPLFQRNRNSLLASGVAGEHGIVGDELVFSGLRQNVSYGIGQFHYESDGFRENNGQETDTYNFLLQASLSHKTSIMTEGYRTETEYGDLPLRFTFTGENNFSLNRRGDRDERLIRLGLRHDVSPQSHIISHVAYINAEESDHDQFLGNPFPFDSMLEDTGYMFEAQHLFSGKRFNLTSGLGYFHLDRKSTITFIFENSAKPEVNHTNFYCYTQIFYPRNFTWTIGGSADVYEDDETKDRDQFNPKFGLSVEPFSGTTLRAAVFRTLKRSLAGKQTIEPTQVAGFNQFFDDPNGADSWRHGLAIDQTISPRLHGGIEYSKRDIVSASPNISTGEIEDADWDERLTRAYVYWTPNDMFALSAEYQFEEFKRQDLFTGEEQISKLKTHRIPLGINYFHPNGISTKLKWTYIDQEGIFGTEPADSRHGEDQFWLVDISMRYRFPNRLGFITAGVQNLFDNNFNYQDMDLANQTIFPERTILGKVTLSF